MLVAVPFNCLLWVTLAVRFQILLSEVVVARVSFPVTICMGASRAIVRYCHYCLQEVDVVASRRVRGLVVLYVDGRGGTMCCDLPEASGNLFLITCEM